MRLLKALKEHFIKQMRSERGTMAWIAIGLVVIAGAGTGVAMAQASKSQQGAANYAADQARISAQLQERTALANAKFIQAAGAEESKSKARDVARLKGSQEAAFGALGLSGKTAEDIRDTTFDEALLDKAAIRYNADVNSWQAMEEGKNKAWTLRSEGAQYDMASRNIGKASQMNTFTTVLNTAASAASVGAASGALKKPGSTNTKVPTTVKV